MKKFIPYGDLNLGFDRLWTPTLTTYPQLPKSSLNFNRFIKTLNYTPNSDWFTENQLNHLGKKMYYLILEKNVTYYLKYSTAPVN